MEREKKCHSIVISFFNAPVFWLKKKYFLLLILDCPSGRFERKNVTWGPCSNNKSILCAAAAPSSGLSSSILPVLLLLRLLLKGKEKQKILRVPFSFQQNRFFEGNRTASNHHVSSSPLQIWNTRCKGGLFPSIFFVFFFFLGFLVNKESPSSR